MCVEGDGGDREKAESTFDGGSGGVGVDSFTQRDKSIKAEGVSVCLSVAPSTWSRFFGETASLVRFGRPSRRIRQIRCPKPHFS